MLLLNPVGLSPLDLLHKRVNHSLGGCHRSVFSSRAALAFLLARSSVEIIATGCLVISLAPGMVYYPELTRFSFYVSLTGQ